MSHRSPSISRFLLLAAAVIAATGGAASVGRTQQVTGSIGVSLTILAPAAGPQLRVSGFDLGRDGILRLETTLPTSAATSQLVMTRISRSTTGFALEPQPPMLVSPSSTESRMRYLVNVGRATRTAGARPTEVRVEYLIVAGT